MNTLLDDHDMDNLAQLAKKLQVVRDRVAGVAMRYISGCIITGRGGTGKSWTATEELARLGVPFILHNTHLTPRALFDQLADNPSAVHLIEDAEEVTRSPVSLGVLRSATWGSCQAREGGVKRLITWRAHGTGREAVFDGGIVLISNRSLGDLPEMRALATRVPTLELKVTDDEIAALMRSVALKGYRSGDTVLGPEESLEVAEFVVRESAQLKRPLDMRLLINAFADRLQADDHDAGCTWQDLVASTLQGWPSVTGDIEPVGIRKITKARELEITREICGLAPGERLQVWAERTGKSQAALYRRLAELGRIDAPGYEI
jgi:hypothetical protein